MCIMIVNTAMSVTKIIRKKTRWVFRERQEAGDFTQLILKTKQLGDAFTFRENDNHTGQGEGGGQTPVACMFVQTCS